MEIFIDKKFEEERFAQRRVVVKIGTSTFCEEGGIIHAGFVNSLAEQVVALREQGVQTAIVCSGAVALGRLRRPELSFSEKDKRIAAAIGQPVLMQAWNKALFPVPALQFLFTEENLGDESTKETLVRGLTYGVPIINGPGLENNDSQAAKIAQMLDAEALVLLTNTHGIKRSDNSTVSVVRNLAEVTQHITPTTSIGGSGGMGIKAESALSFAHATGKAAFIAHGGHSLAALLQGNHQGATRFAPA